MFFFEGQSCPVCGQHFGESDDVVVCPDCGAPHHRECWQQEGHCHFAADHGTERQWAKPDTEEQPVDRTTRKCPNCGRENPEFAEFCSYCGREIDGEGVPTGFPPQQPRVNQYTPPSQSEFSPFQTVYRDPFGGVPRTESIDGVSVETIADVVGTNSQYYLPRFYKMSRTGKKISWNWAAFFIPYNWLLYRKNMLWGWLCFGFLSVINFFNSTAYTPLLEVLPSLYENQSSAAQLPKNAQILYLILLITMAVSFAVKVLLGMFGNWIYMQSVLKKARKLQQDPNLHYDQDFLGTGGVSFAMAALPDIILMFAQYIILIFQM